MAFYSRTIQIEGITYKQIGPNQWQNLNTNQVIDNTLLSAIVNQYKSKKVLTPTPTPSGGATGACCEIVNGVMQCSEKREEACSGGCFKGPGTNCFVTEENPDACSECVHCCFVGAGCFARSPSACLAAGGTYFGSNGCTACKFGVCSSDPTVTERFYGNGCTGVFIEGGGPASFDVGVYCTGSGAGQTCFGPGMRYQNSTPVFIEGGTCSNCINGACCTGGTCLGITSQSNCSLVGGIFVAGQTCTQCDFGVFCEGATTNRTCIRTGYRGEALSNQFQAGATCNYCITGTCCVNGNVSFGDGVRQTICNGNFFAGIFASDACVTGSCCLGASCNENVFRYDCLGVFNVGMTCIACSSGACCLASGGCTLTSMATCMATGGTFFGGATCSACDTGSCCNSGICTEQRRGNPCPGNFYGGINCDSSPCIIGSCCVGATCVGSIEAGQCTNLGGNFYGGLTCIACATGANCDTETDETGERICYPNVRYGDVQFGGFYQNQGCSACESGACCGQSGGGVTGIRGDCTGTSTFYKGQTLYICDAGVFCTGSGVGQTCFGLGHRGQSLTNNFIAGATCSSCILGACCKGGTCIGNGLTSQAACNATGGLFYPGATCVVCDYGVYCTGATCLSLGYRGQSLTNNFIVGATCSSCILGACCTGGTCSGGGQTSQAACNGLFYPGATCRACDYGVYCTGATCFELGYRQQALTNNFIVGATCSSCILGACCTGGTCFGGGQTSQAACLIAGGTFYVGATCTQCVEGVFCTGSGVGQTCFGLGHRGQSLTNNFIAGATCSSCILGACCTGGTCYGGTLTSQATCASVGGLFYAGTTCDSCVYGVYCTGSNETTSCLGLGYKAQNLSNQFIINGSCVNDCLYGACCQGTTCLGITSQGNCPKPYSFFLGLTCAACDTGQGACCTGGSSSITTISGCNAIGGIFFPEGTTALCVTGSCCTGGTCTEELTGRSGNCQLFIAGATCSICDSGVYCTGSTCFGLGFRGQSLTNNFIQGATCSSCILGICCTGGTCIGGGVTAQINCPSSVGSFVIGATQCSACAVNVNCCVGGTHSYILRESCVAQGGIVFEGAEDTSSCISGVFCTGATCAGETLFGFNLGSTFIVDGDCGDCIYGICCNDDYSGSVSTKNGCNGNFYPGETDTTICTAGLTFGLCCVDGTCTEEIEQSDCSGYFISNETAQANSLSCGANACEIGICCGENAITSVTGGVCLGVMTRAECALTGGDFFSNSSGATCSNCIYTPMLASVVLRNIRDNINNDFNTVTFEGRISGRTGNEINPVLERSTSPNTWISSRTLSSEGRFYAFGTNSAITGPVQLYKDGSYVTFRYFNFGGGFTAWYDTSKKLFGQSYNGLTLNYQGTTGLYDYSPVFNLGITRQQGYSFGYIEGTSFESPRYMRFVLGYGNPDDTFADTNIVFRFSHTKVAGTDASYRQYSRTDATKHAQLDENSFNIYPAQEFMSNNDGSNDYSSPILVQMFAENPLTRRIRPVGSCCVGATCIGIVTEDHCTFRGGSFNVNGRCNRCYPELVFGNCCAGGTHAGFTSLAACNAISGTFFEGTTYNGESCVYGTICTEDRQCYQGASFSYYGAFSSTNNKFFIEQQFGTTLGCLACDAGLCCVGATCMGKIPKVQCDALGGTIYYDENTCETNCDLGICCSMSGGCGTYTNRANCYGVNQVFVAGATSGATCSACASLMTLTSYTPGVTYTMVFNQGTTNGTFYDGSPWVQEKDGLKLLKVKISYVGMTGSRVLNFSANTKVAGLTLTPSGYKGSVYVHGSAKNPEPVSYYDPTLGQVLTKEPFISITYEDYNSGWLGPKSIGATDNPVNYSQFDLTSFLNMQGQFKYTGVTMKAGDVFVASASNFDNEKTETSFVANASGYVYQLFTRRANTLTYGVLNCLSATGAALAGSTSCFRPPVTWKPEDRINRPIYKISDVEGKIPGQSGHTLIHVSTSAADDNLIYDVETAASYAQASEFGAGANYGTTTPVWAMGGARTSLTSYGEQFIAPLQTLLETIHATGSARTRLTHEQRKDGLIRIVQYGLDSWGAQTVFSSLAAGAGQKAGRTRGWIPLAGYYLGVSAMYDPEATMILDTARTQKWSENVYESINAISPEGSCITRAQWRRFRSGDTGPENNYRGLRRQLANHNSHDALTMYEYVNNPANLVLHYDYVGKAYRGTVISGFGTGGATGITFYNEYRKQTIDEAHDRVSVVGNFGVIRWGSTLSSENPLSRGYFGYSNKAGSGGSFKGMWLRVESGPGSSGPGGATASRFYRILWSNGFRSDSEPVPAKINSQGGWQIVIGQTWADGMPDHTSVIKFYPYIQADMGLTRPSYFDPLGYTYGPVGFIRVAQPNEGCGATWSGMADATLWDANSSGESPYFQNSLDAWAPQYLLADYLMRTKGVTLVSDAFNIPDYIRQYVYTSPWNIHGLYPWYSGTSSIFNTWLGTTWTDATLAESRINFAQHYPGIVNYRGITV